MVSAMYSFHQCSHAVVEYLLCAMPVLVRSHLQKVLDLHEYHLSRLVMLIRLVFLVSPQTPSLHELVLFCDCPVLASTDRAQGSFSNTGGHGVTDLAIATNVVAHPLLGALPAEATLMVQLILVD